MKNKTISILVYNLSSNALVRTYPIAKTLSRKYNVEIIGVLLRGQIYNPYKEEFNFKVVSKKRKGILGFIGILIDMVKYIEGDIIYAFKPKLTSFGAGLIAKFYKKIPLVLDIEDLETANWIENNFFGKFRLIFSRFDSENEFINYLIQKMIPLADEKIVVSKLLRNKFGGTIVVHGVDVDTFNPSNFNKLEARKALNLDADKILILFTGLPRKHKGIEELIKAIKNINIENVKLLLVGGTTEDKYVKKLIQLGQSCLLHTGPRPHRQMPNFLAASDIVILPQRKTLFASAQIPAKIFEAMAMKKPIIATRVSDLEEILEGCGIVIDPVEETFQLEEKIRLLIDDSEYSSLLGRAAMEKCINHYSWDGMADKLDLIFDKYLS